MNLIEKFVAATWDMPSPEIFRRWAGVGMVSSAMSRRCWTQIVPRKKLFGNLYIMLVSKPGLGKTVPIDEIETQLRLIKPRPLLPGKGMVRPISFIPDEVTRQRHIQQLGTVFSEAFLEGDISYATLVDEWATWMPEPDPGYLQSLAKLWDCKDQYEKETKFSGNDYLAFPYINIIAGCHPAWMRCGFPQRAYEMGFPARTFFIHSEEVVEKKFFSVDEGTVSIDAIHADLEDVAKATGFWAWEPAAVEAFKAWAEGGFEPAPTDPILEHYATRRAQHCGKLSLVCAIAAHPSEPFITLTDLQTAWTLMFDAEIVMPQALAEAGGNEYAGYADQIAAFVEARWLKDKTPVHEGEIRRRLSKLVPPNMSPSIVTDLIAQQKLKVFPPAGGKPAPERMLKPGRGMKKDKPKEPTDDNSK